MPNDPDEDQTPRDEDPTTPVRPKTAFHVTTSHVGPLAWMVRICLVDSGRYIGRDGRMTYPTTASWQRCTKLGAKISAWNACRRHMNLYKQRKTNEFYVEL